MSTTIKDPLLTVAKVVLVIAEILSVFGIVVMTIIVGALLLGADSAIMAEMDVAQGAPGAYWGLVAVLVLTGALFFIGLTFVIQLKRIVLSVERGAPFDPHNATRLATMAWLVIGAQAIALIGSLVAGSVAELGERSGSEPVRFDFGLDGGGILLVVVLFILARVFRKGAEMREDLEGTV